jgi:N-acetylglucosaminyldiphosphoundecaprenol N-acetyl-beta-D-mannosaminyltransferase
LRLLARAAREELPVGFYGAAPQVLQRLVSRVQEMSPAPRVAYRFSPPYGPIGEAELERVAQDIADSGTRILFVGLGCPKQEIWMYRQRGRIPAVMVGVGAAFDYLAGTKRQAPPALRRLGLEWLFRLATEPRRLWRRYLRHNPRFVLFFARQAIGRDGGPERSKERRRG